MNGSRVAQLGACRVALRLFPARYREQYRAEIITTHLDKVEAGRTAPGEIAGLLWFALRLWARVVGELRRPLAVGVGVLLVAMAPGEVYELSLDAERLLRGESPPFPAGALLVGSGFLVTLLCWAGGLRRTAMVVGTLNVVLNTAYLLADTGYLVFPGLGSLIGPTAWWVLQLVSSVLIVVASWGGVLPTGRRRYRAVLALLILPANFGVLLGLGRLARSLPHLTMGAIALLLGGLLSAACWAWLRCRPQLLAYLGAALVAVSWLAPKHYYENDELIFGSPWTMPAWAVINLLALAAVVLAVRQLAAEPVGAPPRGLAEPTAVRH